MILWRSKNCWIIYHDKNGLLYWLVKKRTK